jgi:hypothetical protein
MPTVEVPAKGHDWQNLVNDALHLAGAPVIDAMM